MIYVYKNTLSTFSGWTIPESCIQVEDEVYNKLVSGELMWDNDTIVPNPNYAAEQEARRVEEERLAQIESIKSQIAQKKALLNKYKEDVEQVDLFGMHRDDYAQKKAECANLVLELRELEAQLNGN